MVPVRKPGRPLSQCPHPGGQNCMCGSVTAAIPRKQGCHCGGSGPTNMAPIQLIPRSSLAQGLSNPISPTKPSFKIQKSSGPSSSRRQSYDPANLERMDMSSVNVTVSGTGIPKGYAAPAAASQDYQHAAQYANMPPQLPLTFMQPPPVPQEMVFSQTVQQPPYTNGTHSQKCCCTTENSVAAPTPYPNGGTSNGLNGVPAVNGTKERSISSTNGGSCCASNQNGHDHDSSNTTPAPEPIPGQRSSTSPAHMEQEAASTSGMPLQISPAIAQQMLPQTGLPFSNVLYPVQPSATYTYPPTYGSFQNPLNPSAWRQGMQSNSYSQAPPPVSMPPTTIPYDASFMNTDTVHTCDCGDGCQCVGCAAHPYNTTTQAYVRSAWEAMDQRSETHSNGHTPQNSIENTAMQPQGADPVSSPPANTPSSTTSGNGEELNLSEADYLFVNYPFLPDDGCGGDTMSCPCGDDCQCLGCTIHNQTADVCEGDAERCPCGDDCKCMGCSLHKPIAAT